MIVTSRLGLAYLFLYFHPGTFICIITEAEIRKISQGNFHPCMIIYINFFEEGKGSKRKLIPATQNLKMHGTKNLGNDAFLPIKVKGHTEFHIPDGRKKEAYPLYAGNQT